LFFYAIFNVLNKTVERLAAASKQTEEFFSLDTLFATMPLVAINL
jgi:hypothetical protein